MLASPAGLVRPRWGEPSWIRLLPGTQIVIRDDGSSLTNLVETIGATLLGPSTAVHYIIDATAVQGAGIAFTWNIYARLLGQVIKKATATFNTGGPLTGGATIDASANGQGVDAWSLGISKNGLGTSRTFAFTIAGIAYGREVAF
jgi:hypothetical protein